MKKLLATLLAVVMLIGVFTGNVLAAESVTEGQPAETAVEAQTEAQTATPGAALRKLAGNMRTRAQNFAKIAKKYPRAKIGKTAKVLATRLYQVANRADAFAKLREDATSSNAARFAARKQLIAALLRAAKAADSFAALREAAATGNEEVTPGSAVRKLAENIRIWAEKLTPKKAAENQ